MKRLDFSINIDAPCEKVWNVLWNDRTYPEWTSPFSPTSKVETNWKKGTKAVFGDDGPNGMVAIIAENIPNEFMSLQHIGVIKNGQEDLTIAEREGWSGALENYTLMDTDGRTQLHIEIDTIEREQEFLKKTWPQALEKVKELSESR